MIFVDDDDDQTTIKDKDKDKDNVRKGRCVEDLDKLARNQCFRTETKSQPAATS